MNKLLKFITCGSVDDGKSTLIGHMLYDAKLLFADQERALELDSKVGSREGEIDYALLLDGLMAEREQGITIDVAYRYFTTDNRSFIVADTPGHEEYTRNMAVGASFAELAVILVDASRGIQIQTWRHARICKLMGIRHFVFAINKMDLVKYDRDVFRKMEKSIRKLSVDLELENVKIIPVSATAGDNINVESANMTWYKGGTLLNHLETVDVSESAEEEGFVMPIQRVCRPNHEYRGFQGQIESGEVAVGDELEVLPSNEKAVVKSIYVGDRDEKKAGKGQPVSIQLDREIDVSRGCVFVKDTRPEVSRLFRANILWMDDDRLVQGKSYLVRIGTKEIAATIQSIEYKIEINTGEHLPAETLRKNELAECEIALAEGVVLDKFENHRALGELLLIDRVTNMTSACGVVLHSMRRSTNLTWQKTDITREIRSEALGQKPLTLWFTGLSGSGKSTLANAIEKVFSMEGKHTMLLDGDNIRMGLNNNLGFDEKDRIENIRRIAEVAKLMNDAGLIVLTSFISPYTADRERAKDIIGTDSYIEIYVSTPLEECEKRDVKGLYAKARRGEIPNFTGISSAYEKPQNPAVEIDTSKYSLEDAVDYVIEKLKEYLRDESE
ncbi:MAG: adenylyl-sulfate kinase [Eubacterium sp.]|nr:adenylyl-sulfate kinase [Eubacterium sp.]